MKKLDLIGTIAHIKIILFYGAELLYPVFTLFTAVGIAKVAFGIPAWTAVVIMGCAVFGCGLFAIKGGVFGRDLDIKWNNTPSAKRLCEQVDRIERLLDEK